MKTSRDRWVKNRYPQIKAGMSRRDCADCGGPPATTCPWNAQPASSVPSNPDTGGSKPSGAGRNCSLKPWRSTPDSGAGWPLTRPLICTGSGCLWQRRSWEPVGGLTGSETSPKETAGERTTQNGEPLRSSTRQAPHGTRTWTWVLRQI